ncbi:MAG: hypothetical protein NXI32_11505 [bacterium]|nr:hypothetical protein [bacterium]
MELQELIGTWLPKAERWIESERTKAIRCLVVYSARTGPSNPWRDLPAYIQRIFERGRRSCERLNGQTWVVAFRGELTGWREFFDLADYCLRGHLQYPGAEILDTPIANLALLIVRLLNDESAGFGGRLQGGQWMNLDPRFGLRINGMPADGSRMRFPISGHHMPGLQDSADNYGAFAELSDLRIASVAAIRWYESLRARDSSAGWTVDLRDQTEEKIASFGEGGGGTRGVNPPAVGSECGHGEPDFDAVESVLRGLLLALFQRLRKTKHFVAFDTLADEVAGWRKLPPKDRAIVGALKRLKDAIGEFDFDLEIHSSDRRAKLVFLRTN